MKICLLECKLSAAILTKNHVNSSAAGCCFVTGSAEMAPKNLELIHPLQTKLFTVNLQLKLI